jgi:hypothetical protein
VKRYRRILLIGLVAALVALAARVAAPSHARPLKLQAAFACGVERWGIKTLKDHPRLYPARRTTVAHLVSLRRPSPFPPAGRLKAERHIYSVVAAVTLDRSEADLDHHLVLRSGKHTMIAETPAPTCTVGATTVRRKQMKSARAKAGICAKARVVGVAFFDFLHGQTGVAPNGIELHPVLGFYCIKGRGKIPPPPPPPSGKRCAASYPDECIPPPPPELNCADIPYRNFRVRWNVANPDPQGFDGDRDGIGCET